jgi:hypothetical protein
MRVNFYETKVIKYIAKPEYVLVLIFMQDKFPGIFKSDVGYLFAT